jgi:hypothetical protein
MPIDYKEYHTEWKRISKEIREREGNCCKFCGIANGSIIRTIDRLAATKEDLDKYDAYRAVKFSHGPALKAAQLTKIVLTVAHIDHDKDNNDFNNLAALCQRCHLKLDLNSHITNRKYGRKWNRMQLFFEFYNTTPNEKST